MSEELPVLERLEAFWEQHNQRINTIIGKLCIPAMQTRHPMVIECHRELIDFAAWVDEQFKGIEE